MGLPPLPCEGLGTEVRSYDTAPAETGVRTTRPVTGVVRLAGRRPGGACAVVPAPSPSRGAIPVRWLVPAVASLHEAGRLGVQPIGGAAPRRRLGAAGDAP